MRSRTIAASLLLFLAPAGAPAEGPATAGIVRVTRRGPALVAPADTPAGETWRYQLCQPLQIAPRRAAALVNIRKGQVPYMDFEVGVDLVPFDDPAALRAEDALRLARSREEPNPNATPPGRKAFMSMYPSQAGCVPFGARRADRSPHPHAGTGFALTLAVAKDLAAPFSFANIGGYFLGPEAYEYYELHQWTAAERSLRASGTRRLSRTELVAGWSIAGGGLTNAIPDGDDLLLPATGGKPGAPPGAGVMRWRREQSAWRATSFLPVPGTEGTTEPSLVRDVDGAWLLTARGGPQPEAIRVWRSADGGATWREVVHAGGVISGAPVTINQAADGTPYVAACVKGWARDLLCLWPLDAERRAVGMPIVARFCFLEFGAPRYGRVWESDHPSAMTVRLADGKWHNVIGYRILERAEKEYGSPPSPRTGAYLEEVISAGPARPAWIFE